MAWNSYCVFFRLMACLFAAPHNVMMTKDHSQLTRRFTFSFANDDLCTNQDLKYHLTAICLRVSANNQEIEDRYDDKTVKLKSDCEDELSPDLGIDHEKKFPFRRTVGRCYLSPKVSKCIIKDSEDKSVLVFSYVNRECRDPIKMSYDFSTSPPIEATFLTPRQFLDWRCSSICEVERLRRHVPSICLRISSAVENHFNDLTLVRNSRCNDEIPVGFQINKGAGVHRAAYSSPVGMCHLSTDVIKCVTTGEKYDSVFVFSFYEGVCIEPRQIDYNFDETPFTETDEFSRSIDDQKSISKENESFGGLSNLFLASQSPSLFPRIKNTTPAPAGGATIQHLNPSPSSTSRLSASSAKNWKSAMSVATMPPSSSFLVSKSPSSKNNGALWSCWSSCLEWFKSLFGGK